MRELIERKSRQQGPARPGGASIHSVARDPADRNSSSRTSPSETDAPLSLPMHTLVLGSGERFPVLLDGRGVPLQFALMYAIRDREGGGVDRLKGRLRRIRELYQAFGGMGIDLDEAILERKVDIRDVESAVYWLEEESESRENEEEANGKPISATMRNQRVSAWADFTSWAIESGNWTLRSRPQRDRRERDAAIRLRILLDDLRLPIAASRQVYPLASRELAVLDDLLGPGPGGEFALSPFSGNAARRTWVLYQLLRWGGMRLGESLKLRMEDAPPREREADAILREVEGGALSLQIRRRVDDREDERRNEPAVKRLGRSVPMPDCVLHLIWDYIDALPDTSRYLIRTADGAHALSYSQASKVCYEIRPHAVRLFEERHPGDPHSLDGLRWHRLRHTRAVEMLREYFPDGRADPIGVRRFCDGFGWALLSSADPYLRLLHRREGEVLWQQSLERLR